jgi:hypothetical protein
MHAFSSARSTRVPLHEVTLCAVDCINPALAARALSLSAMHCEFADVLLLTDTTSCVSRDIRIVPIEPIRSSAEYSRFVLKELHRHITTPWMLIVQWDGYVIRPDAWRDEFLEYDYIGARWPGLSPVDVGNGGFSLRSTRLMQRIAQRNLAAFEDLPEDVVICRALRSELEAEHGMRFAPATLADRFSYEFATPNRPTFGFHGVSNLWRHMDDADTIKLLHRLDRRTFSANLFVGLLFTYFDQRRFDCMDTLFARLTETISTDKIVSILQECGANSDQITACMELCTRED